MINSKYLLTALLTSSSLFAMAKADITGTVTNKNTGTPIDYADVRIINARTGKAILIAAQTDDAGHFTLKNVPDGNYIVEITNMGSVKQERHVTVANSMINLGEIKLADDVEMVQEVVVSGVKGQMAFELDRKVFNVDSNIASAGASASELLESIPSVEVDQDGEVSLRGNSSVTVWINGKESGLTADNRAQILEQIPAETIDKIEVITNPSAKYSPEGTAGIINIVLKKDRRSGYFGSAEIGANTRGGGNVNANINYNVGKFDTYAGIGFRMRHSRGGSESSRIYEDNSWLNSEGKSKNHGNNLFIRLGATYHLTNKDDFYVSAFGMLGHRWNHSRTTYKQNIPGQWSLNDNYTHESGDMRGAHLEWGYMHKFSDTHTLDMNVSFNRWGGPSTNLYIQDQEWSDPIAEESVYQQQEQSVNSNNWEAKIDYTNQLLPWLKLEAGYNGNYNHENTPVAYYTGSTADNLALDPNLFNRFIYNNNISALYFTLGGKVKNFSFSAGLRAEAWQVRTKSLSFGETADDVQPYKKNDFALFPSVFLSWSLPHDNELQINYTRRIRRPWGPQLNSFMNISDPTSVHMGNPELTPEYSNSFELNYIKSWTSHMISLSGYIRTSSDMISHVSFMAPAPTGMSEVMYETHANVGRQVNSGAEIVVKNQFFNCLDITTTVNLYNNHISAWSINYPLYDKEYHVSSEKQDRFAWDIRCMPSVKLPWGLSVQVTGRYNSKQLTAQGSREAGWSVDAGVRKTAGNWSFSLNARDIFDSRKWHNFTYGNDYTQESKRWRNGRTLRLTIKYSFGNMHAKRNRRAESQINSGGYGDEGE